MSMIIANWKMHGDALELRSWMAQVSAKMAQKSSQIEVIFCPPAVFLSEAKSLLGDNKTLLLGAQDCHHESCGAFTGDISADMLKKSGADYIIIGHSERRLLHGETSEIIAKKCNQVQLVGVIPVVCVGESESERAAGNAESVVKSQLVESLKHITRPCIIAYEPVWAIGSGSTPKLEEIAQMHRYIKSLCDQMQLTRDRATRVVYGGSVNAQNAASILALPEVDGALIGSASVKAESFCEIIEVAQLLTLNRAVTSHAASV